MVRAQATLLERTAKHIALPWRLLIWVMSFSMEPLFFHLRPSIALRFSSRFSYMYSLRIRASLQQSVPITRHFVIRTATGVKIPEEHSPLLHSTHGSWKSGPNYCCLFVPRVLSTRRHNVGRIRDLNPRSKTRICNHAERAVLVSEVYIQHHSLFLPLLLSFCLFRVGGLACIA